MALIEFNDFNCNFQQDFGRDAEDLARGLDRTLDGLARDVRGQFDEMAADISRYRGHIVEMAQNTYADLANDRNTRGDKIAITVDATLAVIAAGEENLRRRSTRESEDWIEQCFRENPVLIQATQQHQQSRYDDRQLARRSYSGNNNRDRNYGNNSGGSRYQQQSNNGGGNQGNNNGPRYRGRLQTQQDEPMEQQYQQQEKQTYQPEPSVADGSVITSNNVKDVIYKGQPVAYIIGKEQVVIKDGKLIIVPYDGRNAMDYEKHRIDRFYVDVMPTGATELELTRIALAEATKVKDNKIASFINEGGETPSDELLEKAFKAATSSEYSDVINLSGTTFDPIGVRDGIIETHKTNFEWFADHALLCTLNQSMFIDDCSNDTAIRIKELIKSENITETVKLLIKLAGMFDTAVWRKLHDIITCLFNMRLLSIGSVYNVDSITAYWSELVEAIKENEPPVESNLSVPYKMLSVLDWDEENKAIVVKRKTMFLPINSFDLDIGVLDKESPVHHIPSGSMLYNALVNALDHDHLVTMVTLDGVALNVATFANLSGTQAYLLNVAI